MKDSAIARSFFEVGIVLALAAMVFGPFEIKDWSLACGATACFLAVAGIYFAFESWNEVDTPPQVQKPDQPKEILPDSEQQQGNTEK